MSRALSTCLAFAHVTVAVDSGTPVQIWSCEAGVDRQTWSLLANGYPNEHVQLGGANGVPFTGLVLNTLGYSNATGGTLNVWNVKADPTGLQWKFDSTNGHIKSGMNGMCAGTLNATGVLPAGTSVVQVPCADVSAVQWTHNASTGQLVWVRDPTMCLDAGSSASCNATPYSAYGYCNTSWTASARAADLITHLLPVEAASMLAASNNGIPRLGVPKLKFGEALHGVAGGCGAPYTDSTTGHTSTGCPTSFPTGLALGSSLNRSLWAAIGNVIGTEARALYNQGVAESMFFTPDINPFRDPRWGRGMEVPGEDPYIAGEYAAEYIYAFQGQGGPSGGQYMRSVSMVKHFSGYDQEGNRGPHDRTNFCAPIPMQFLVGYHWPSFKTAVQRGKAGGLMCSANGVNGYPTCAHADYNNGILRASWGWDGAMVTDGNGVTNLYAKYGVGQSALNCQPVATGWTNAVHWGLRGGVDVELGETLNNYALEAIADGNITWADVNTALGRTLPFLFKLGLLDPPETVPWAVLGPQDVDTQASRQLALEAGIQSIVLLRNNASATSPNGPHTPVLPLSRASLAGKTIAILGPNADNATTLLANYHGQNTLVYNHTPRTAITSIAEAAGASVRFALGCADVLCVDSTGISAAVTAAQGSAVAILIVGLAPTIGGPQNTAGTVEGEELDRTTLALPGQQEALISAILSTGVPVVLVRMRGGCTYLSPALYSDPRLTTVVESVYPGELGGDAIAAILFGDSSPSGRLATTVYDATFETSRNITDYDMSTGDGVTYQYYTGQPQWPFGYGLSYTTWSLAWLEGEQSAASHSSVRTVQAGAWASGLSAGPAWGVNVTNTGSVTSDVSVLAFIESGQAGQPKSQVFDFQRAAGLAPGASVTLLFSMSLDSAGRVDKAGEVALVAGEYGIRIGMPGHGDGLEGSMHITVDTEPGQGEGKVLLQRAPPPM